MATKKSKSMEEYLRGIVRSQKAEIKHLKKEIARQNKRSHLYSDLEEKQAEEFLEEEKAIDEVLAKDKCPHCSIGDVEKVDLGPRKLYICNSCGKRIIRK